MLTFVSNLFQDLRICYDQAHPRPADLPLATIHFIPLQSARESGAFPHISAPISRCIVGEQCIKIFENVDHCSPAMFLFEYIDMI